MDEFDIQLQDAISRRRSGQEAAQSFQMPQGRMVGGRYIGPGLNDVLVQGLRMYQGQKDAEQAGQQIKDLTASRQKALADALRQKNEAAAAEELRIKTALETMTPQQAIAAGVPIDRVKGHAEAPNFGRSKVVRTVEIMGEDGLKRVQQYDEYGQPIGDSMSGYVAPVQVNQGGQITFATPKPGQSFAVGMSPSPRDSSAQSRLDADKGLTVADAGGLGQSALSKQFGKAAAGFRWKSDGSMEFIPGGPADEKAQQQKTGAGTVGSVVADLRDRYSKLQEGGGIVESGGNTLSNIRAYASSSDVGQVLGGMLGTKNQGERDSIAMTRPLLLQAIMKATGMSAKQMDSNAELKLYLATATDPTKGLQANMAALDRIEQMFGGGASNPNSAGLPGAGAPPKEARPAMPQGFKVVR
jgi:hypothetical protein